MTLPIVLDSWWEPSLQQVQQAKAAGVVGWFGYFSQYPGEDAIYHGWADPTFKMIQANGLVSGAYVSGWDDPGYCQSRATSLGVIAILDCETSIKAEPYNGVYWVDTWLKAAPSIGLYSNTGSGVLENHVAHNHPCYVAAAYPGGSGGYSDPGTYWVGDVATPSTPYGWQYADTSQIPGFNCDSSHLQPSLLALANRTPIQDNVDMASWIIVATTDGNGEWVVDTDGGLYGWSGTTGPSGLQVVQMKTDDMNNYAKTLSGKVPDFDPIAINTGSGAVVLDRYGNQTPVSGATAFVAISPTDLNRMAKARQSAPTQTTTASYATATHTHSVTSTTGQPQ